jgi:alkaline phosphatase D
MKFAFVNFLKLVLMTLELTHLPHFVCKGSIFNSEKKQVFGLISSDTCFSSWASNLTTDYNNPDAPVFGAEFVGTSITTGGNGSDLRVDTAKYLADNPHTKFFNNYRGYVRCQVTPEQWRADYRVVPFVTEPGADISTRTSFVYEKDQTGIKEIAATTVPIGVQKSEEVEEDRHRAHARAHEIQMEKKRKREAVTN